MIAVTVVLSMVIIALMIEMAQNVTSSNGSTLFVTFDVKALNSTAIEIEHTGSTPLQRSLISVIIDNIDYHDSGLVDANRNGFWDSGEVMQIDDLDTTAGIDISISCNGGAWHTGLPDYLPATPTPTATSEPTPVPLPTPPPPEPPAPCPTPVVTPEPDTLTVGLIATYYDSLNWTAPVLFTEPVTTVMFADYGAVTNTSALTTDNSWPLSKIGRGVNFSVCFAGYLNVPAEDDYCLFLGSDDGSFLQLDGTTVISNGGIHPWHEEFQVIHLTVGTHPIKVFMFQCDNESAINLMYTNTAITTKQPVADLLH